MRKRLFSALVVCLLILTCSVTIFAHSGGTDEFGGHYVGGSDNYHYHHGKPAHQHPDGVCPYKRTEEDIRRDFWIILGVLVGFPVVVIVILKIAFACADAKKKKEIAKLPDFKAYYSTFGDCYHSTSSCSALKKAKTIYTASKKDNADEMFKRYPCVMCCRIENGKVLPRTILLYDTNP